MGAFRPGPRYSPFRKQLAGKVRGLWQREGLCVRGLEEAVRSTEASSMALGFDHERDHPEVAKVDCVGIR